jgi:glycosyltransferase involved in cell wall biosynthesis
MLVTPCDADELMTALLTLPDNPELCPCLTAAARTAARSQWSWDNELRRIVEALR